MKKNLLLILVAAILFASCAKPTYQYPAVFGERMDKNMGYERVVRIFMDKEGLYYPDMFIKDKELKKFDGSLRTWYKSHPKLMSLLYKKYGIKDTIGSVDDNIERIDDAICKNYIGAINILSKDFQSIDISIHGFRERPYGSSTDLSATSRKNYQELESSLLFGTRKEVLFVEVYWDANSFSAFKSPSKAAGLFYHNAVPNAMNVGLKLRKVVPMINKNKDIVIVTNNIGARVAAELLFNASGGFLQGESIYNTPSQKSIKICMIAPAISSSLFENYNNRNPYSPVTGDNYQLSIVYNENDLVDHKKMKLWFMTKGGLSPADSGNTSLGCNFDGDVAKLKDIIKQPELKTYDLSKNGKKKSKCSTLKGCYTKNTAKFAEVADYLGDKATYVPPAPYVPLDKRKAKRPGAPVRHELTPAEKAQIKADKKALEKQKAEEKKHKEEERREIAKQKAEEKKMAEQARIKAGKEKLEQMKIADEEKKQAAKAKEIERRQKEKDREEAAKVKDQERRQKEKDREVLAKQKEVEKRQQEKDRADAARMKEDERRQKEKDRANAAKQKEEERRQAEKDKAEAARQLAKEKAAVAKQKEDERNQAAKDKAEAAKQVAREKAAAAKQKEEERRDLEKQKAAEKKELEKQKAAEKKEKDRAKDSK